MTSSEGLIHRSLADFARAAAAEGPVPGSGSVSAAAGALGAGLAIMAVRPGRHEGDPSARAEREGFLAERMERLLACVDEDAEAYRAYLDARAGRGDLARGVARSIAVPQEVAEQALAALARLLDGLHAVRPRRASEAFTAGHVLLAAAEGAMFTARSNLPALAEPRDRDARRSELAALHERAAGLRRSLDEHFRSLQSDAR